MKTRKAASLLLFIPVMLFLCGFLFDTVTVMVDTEKNHVFEAASADDILSDFGKDQIAAEKRYKDKYFIISGKIESISPRGDMVLMTGSSVTDNRIICECFKDLRSQALKFSRDRDWEFTERSRSTCLIRRSISRRKSLFLP